MPYYLFQAIYKSEQIKSLIGNPQDRSEQARVLIEGLGGKLHQLFFSFGDFDIVAIIETPDNASMAAGSMAVTAAGTTSACKTTPLLTMEEAMDAMRKSGVASGYSPPSG